jgi:hypothetical protein
MLNKIFLPAIFIIALFVFSSSNVSSQTMYFGEGVDKDGYAITPSTTFNINKSSGGFLYVLVRLPYTIDCRAVSFVIHRNGEYDNTITVDTEADWVWFWKQITFYKNGNYTIYAYDCYNELITSGSVRINYN